MIISDNLIFHGHIFDNNQKQSRNLKQLVRKINRYNDWLGSYIQITTRFYYRLVMGLRLA